MSSQLVIPDPALVLLIGPAGSGKSTFAAKHFRAVEIVSSDTLRRLLADDAADQGASAEAFRIVALLVAGRLKRRLMTVIDATNLRAVGRRRYRQLAARHGVPVAAVAFDLPAATYHRHNLGRAERVVVDDVVDRQIELMKTALAILPGEGYSPLHVVREPGTLASLRVVREAPD